MGWVYREARRKPEASLGASPKKETPNAFSEVRTRPWSSYKSAASCAAGSSCPEWRRETRGLEAVRAGGGHVFFEGPYLGGLPYKTNQSLIHPEALVSETLVHVTIIPEQVVQEKLNLLT